MNNEHEKLCSEYYRFLFYLNSSGRRGVFWPGVGLETKKTNTDFEDSVKISAALIWGENVNVTTKGLHITQTIELP